LIILTKVGKASWIIRGPTWIKFRRTIGKLDGVVVEETWVEGNGIL